MKLRVFECDYCKTRTEPINEKLGNAFPYNKDWVYLYSFQAKITKEGRISMEDGHFCCVGCLILTIQNLEVKKHENKRKDNIKE